MSKPRPSKRMSIRDNKQFDEIKYIKNNETIKLSRPLEKLQQKDINEDESSKNELSDLSYVEEVFNDIQYRRESSSGEYETHTRFRYPQQRNTPNDNKTFNLGSSSSHHHLQNIKLESKKNNLKQVNQKISKNTTVNNNTYTSSCWRNSGSLLLIFVLILIGFLICLQYNKYNYETDEDFNVLKCQKEDVQCTTDNVKRMLKSIKDKYNNQDKDLWGNLFIGIRNIINHPKKPFIMILLGDKSDPLNCLAKLLGKVSSNALNSGLLQLTPEKFENDVGSVITSLRSRIKDKKTVIIWDLLNINEEALKAFHNLCDRINPLIEEVIYIITIIADDYDKTIKPLEYVEKKLTKKLSGKLEKDLIQPLITRITDGLIVSVKPEPDLIDCQLPTV
ncbi:uncharacterized protein LOC131664871 [Phymastichus coffea]|uniref:uncharacterized protein LOC131664871 n=1 Tax=Phymastichus coffea TaxID=108790 RepID=UPI00273C41CE|nr:uncharacterized protein LOC131664871 [Phymastichus coffea]